MYLMVSKYLAVHTWWIIYLKDSKHSSHQNLQIKVCCSKHVKQLALNLLHIVKILSFIEAMELSRQATAVYKTTFLLEEHKAQWHCLYNPLRFLNYRIKVPRSCRGPWHHCMSVQTVSPACASSQCPTNAVHSRIQKVHTMACWSPSIWTLLSGSWWDSWRCSVQGQQLDFSDPLESLPAQQSVIPWASLT